MLPARALSTAQLVPNWKLITMPDTTPMPNDTAKIFIQKKYRSRHSESRVRSQRHSRKASQCARPMVNAGNRMWNEITNANCTRDRNSGDSRRSSTRLDSTARGNAAVRIVRPWRDGRKKGAAATRSCRSGASRELLLLLLLLPLRRQGEAGRGGHGLPRSQRHPSPALPCLRRGGGNRTSSRLKPLPREHQALHDPLPTPKTHRLLPFAGFFTAEPSTMRCL